MNEIETNSAWLQAAYSQAVYDKDVLALLRLYDTAVRVFDAWGIWQYEGRAAWQRSAETWFSSLGDERVRVTFADARTWGTADGAFTSATVTYAAVSATGEPLRAMQNRLTWGFRRDGQNPVILHEHTSAPVGPDDLRAILRRPPAA